MMHPQVRLLTLHQPYASFIPLGLKGYETRTWRTTYRGKTAIHAASQKTHKMTEDDWELVDHVAVLSQRELWQEWFEIYGEIVAVADLTDCYLMVEQLPNLNPGGNEIAISGISNLEIATGIWQPGRFAWELDNIRYLPDPIPCRGWQGFRPIADAAVLQAVFKAMNLGNTLA